MKINLDLDFVKDFDAVWNSHIAFNRPLLQNINHISNHLEFTFFNRLQNTTVFNVGEGFADRDMANIEQIIPVAFTESSPFRQTTIAIVKYKCGSVGVVYESEPHAYLDVRKIRVLMYLYSRNIPAYPIITKIKTALDGEGPWEYYDTNLSDERVCVIYKYKDKLSSESLDHLNDVYEQMTIPSANKDIPELELELDYYHEAKRFSFTIVNGKGKLFK